MSLRPCERPEYNDSAYYGRVYGRAEQYHHIDRAAFAVRPFCLRLEHDSRLIDAGRIVNNRPFRAADERGYGKSVSVYNSLRCVRRLFSGYRHIALRGAGPELHIQGLNGHLLMHFNPFGRGIIPPRHGLFRLCAGLFDVFRCLIHGLRR